MSEYKTNNKSLIEGLQSAVSSFFSTMIGVEPTFKDARESDTFTLSADVAGIMYLRRDNPGMVACGTETKLARSIIGKMTGMAEAELDDGDISDGMAEMVNILCGFIKTQYPEMQINLTPPLSLLGKESTITWKIDHPSVVLEFDIEGSELTVAATL